MPSPLHTTGPLQTGGPLGRTSANIAPASFAGAPAGEDYLTRLEQASIGKSLENLLTFPYVAAAAEQDKRRDRDHWDDMLANVRRIESADGTRIAGGESKTWKARLRASLSESGILCVGPVFLVKPS